MADFDTDAVIVGAGAVGLAVGYALARRGLSVIVLERAGRIGAGVSSRNSEVIHAGIHYPTGSWRAKLCTAGRRALYAFLPAHGVSFVKTEKLIVATRDEEIPIVEKLAEQGAINGVENLRMIDAADAMRMEPGLHCVAALLSPETGILDAHGCMLALQGEIEARGGAIALNAPFEGARPEGAGFSVRVGGHEPATLTTRRLVISAGLGAQDCARAVEGFPATRIPRQHLGKGNYFTLAGRAPFARLIYPPPIPGALGVHYTRDMSGRGRFGPDLEWVEAETYDVDASRADGFYAYVRRFWPGLPDGALSPDYAGIRPKIHGPGEAQPDFRIDGADAHGFPGLVALFGIESPGLTSSLALGDVVADMLEGPAR